MLPNPQTKVSNVDYYALLVSNSVCVIGSDPEGRHRRSERWSKGSVAGELSEVVAYCRSCFETRSFLRLDAEDCDSLFVFSNSRQNPRGFWEPAPGVRTRRDSRAAGRTCQRPIRAGANLLRRRARDRNPTSLTKRECPWVPAKAGTAEKDGGE